MRSRQIGDAERRELRLGLGQAASPLRREAQEAPGEILALGDRDRDVLAQAGFKQQRIDLMGAHQAAADARLWLEAGDVVAVQHDGAGIGAQHAGQEIDEAGLAGAVRPDQAEPRAGLEIEVDRLRHRQRAEALGKAAHRQRGGGFGHLRAAPGHSRAPAPRTQSATPIKPPSRNSTIATSKPPITNIQRNGSNSAARSCTTT